MEHGAWCSGFMLAKALHLYTRVRDQKHLTEIFIWSLTETEDMYQIYSNIPLYYFL